MAGDVEVKVSGNTAEAESAMMRLQEVIAEKAEQMKASLESISSSFEMLNTAMASITALIAGGGAFAEMISATVKLNTESAALGKQFGISATEASYLKSALNATHVSQEQFSAAGARVLRTLNTNEGAFKELGVATRDSAGNFRPLGDIMLDTNTALLKFKEGTDRGIEATKIYGKGWQEVAPVLKVTRKEMEEGKATAEELGLAVTKQSEAMTKEYLKAVVGVQEVLEGVSNTIGQAVLPVLTQMGVWFRSVGPQVIEVLRVELDHLSILFGALVDSIKAVGKAFGEIVGIFSEGIQKAFGGESLSTLEFFENVLKVMETAMTVLRIAVQLAAQSISSEITELKDRLVAWGNVIERALHLDWNGVEAAWKAGNEKIAADQEEEMRKLAAITKQGVDDVNNIIMGTLGQKTKGDPTDAPPPGKKSSGGADQFDKELDAWTKQLDLEYQALEKQHQAELALYKEQEAEFGKAAGARIAIAQAEADAQARAYGTGSAQYIEAQKHVVEVTQQAQEQLRQMGDAFSKNEEARQLAEVAADQKVLDEKLAHHEISNEQFVNQSIALEDRRTAIAEQGARQRLAITDPTTDPQTYAQLLAQIEGLEREHQQKITEIRQQAALKDQQLQQQLYKSVQNDFTQSITKMLEGTETLSNGMKNLFKTITQSLIQFLAQWVTQWAATQIENLLATKTSAAGAISAQSAVAGASGVASFAGAPWPLDLGAPAFGSAMAAEALGFGALASAAGGYDIPAGLNPMTQLHENEMVLPAKIADPMRESLEKGGGIGGASNLNLSIKAMDSRSIQKAFTRGGALEKAIRDLHRRGRYR